MKKVCFVVLLITGLLKFQIQAQSVLNGGFEELNSNNTLKYWGNVYLRHVGITDSSGNFSTDSNVYDQGYYYTATIEAHSGKRALLLSNAFNYTQNICTAGAAGIDDDSIFSAWGLLSMLPLHNRVAELSFYYKFLPVKEDSAQALLTLWDSAGNALGEAFVILSGTQSEYKQKIVPVKYVSANEVAYYSLSFSTFYSKNSNKKPTFGTRLWIDDVEMSGTAGVLDRYKDKAKIKIFPNPAKSMLTIQSEIVAEKQVYIYNVTGKLVKLGTMLPNENSISVEDLKSGVYTLELRSKAGKETHCFVVNNE